MIEFKIKKKSSKSKARLGILRTPHGDVETPAYVSVATQGVVKALTAEQAEATGAQLLIANTYHLHIRPGEAIIKKNGGLHEFMHWKRPIMTDSGGFQVFSLGFGRDYKTGKVSKEGDQAVIEMGQQPKLLKITPDGVLFRSYYDGSEMFLGPKESIKIQEKIGADIIFAFDECPSPLADHAYVDNSLIHTHAWANLCLKTKKSKQALYGIVQGGRFKDLREKSARFIGALPFDGFGIGGEFGADKKSMTAMLGAVTPHLPETKPRHLLGIGHIDDIIPIIKSGVDTFDCITPTHYARHGYAFTAKGKLNLNRASFLNDKNPLDKKCSCFVCQNYSRGYITHLLKANEITPLSLLTFHNMYFFNAYVKKMREEIKKGSL